MGPLRSRTPANQLIASLNDTDISFLISFSDRSLMSSSTLEKGMAICSKQVMLSLDIWVQVRSVKTLGVSTLCLFAVDPFGLGPGLLDRCRPKR